VSDFADVFKRLALNSLQLKDHRLYAIGATGDEGIAVLHPGAKVSLHHEGREDLVNVIPGPITGKIFRSLRDT
jgi:hypothetical protein